CAKKEDSLDVG
nr:immunoglobulin heavy chain junction region [Macaca mulatta]